ncbi:Uncharacterised protein [Mycobacteroides abscessus subsp. abscessus]|nr:Uncharacterised protein [Mycobacteroides abscessus subsp. abscessus]
MFSLTPAMPGLKQQTPLMIRSILTPAIEASYNFLMIFLSVREFIFAMILPF